MALALSRQPYKQLFAGIYVIYLGIMTAMFLISGCIGVVKTITEGCNYPPSEDAVCHCIITQIININMVFLPWVLSGFLGAFTFIFYQYYEYLAFEANKNKPEVGTSNAPNEPTPENPFKKIVLLCGITLDVTKMARWVDVICFTVFVEGYAVQFVLFDSPIARLCVAPILFGLSHFVIYTIVHRMQTFERHRVVVTGSFVCFLVLYTLLLLVYGIYNIFVHSNVPKAWRTSWRKEEGRTHFRSMKILIISNRNPISP
uniref:G_PROTEIN_RECEP_F1_2 domain-containing protein n=1 Tax=Steinernema glaseri TaxID=37863 RepID=A0A1I8ARJ8_9BILA